MAEGEHRQHGDPGGQEGQDGNGGHPAHLQHHFESEQQQFDSDKLGMWLFLVTEILLFGGLFCAYAVYRANHPEIFMYAHKYLDKTLGGINTVVLILSSFTMAWAVRAAQLHQRKLLITLLALTLLGGFGFLGIKAVEYEHKWKHGLLWGVHHDPAAYESYGRHADEGAGDHADDQDAAVSHNGEGQTEDWSPGDNPTAVKGTTAGDQQFGAEDNPAGGVPAGEGEAAQPSQGAAAEGAAQEPAAEAAPEVPADAPPTYIPRDAGGNLLVEGSTLKTPGDAPEGLAYLPDKAAPTEAHYLERPENVHLFFGIYFTMTGLHALHVIAGMVIIFVVMIFAIRGTYQGGYFTPVDLTGLYWHLVDLIWIFLFPLLYLIH